ncbi:hypothetical protein PG984_004923 [Apiospora sp. TS-2023a]
MFTYSSNNDATRSQQETKLALLLCVNTGLFQIELGQLELTSASHDEAMFGQIRELYRERRGSLKDDFLFC